LQLIPVLLMGSIFVYLMVYWLPGDVIDALAGEAEAQDPLVRAALEKELGLDQPLYVRYVKWLGKIVLHGDFGKSITTRRSIGVEVFKRIPATVYLAVVAVVISLIIAIPLGAIAAVKHHTLADYTVMVGAVAGLSIPQFWFAILCVLFFALYLGWLPPSEYYSPFDNLGLGIQHLILPASALGVRLAAITTRLTRSAMLDEIHKDYVDTARSIGLPEQGAASWPRPPRGCVCATVPWHWPTPSSGTSTWWPAPGRRARDPEWRPPASLRTRRRYTCRRYR
jgi:peptide/nickel transport system permease protein